MCGAYQIWGLITSAISFAGAMAALILARRARKLVVESQVNLALLRATNSALKESNAALRERLAGLL